MSILDITCANMSDLATDYLEHGLGSEEQTTFETHLIFCADCRTFVAQIRETAEALTGLGGGRIDERERGLLLDAFRSKPR